MRLLCHVRYCVRLFAMLLRDAPYASTPPLCRVRYGHRVALTCVIWSYAPAMRCSVLKVGMLPRLRYAMPSTEIAYVPTPTLWDVRY
eukprot:2337421-Rhodomonas_salina.1